MKTVQAKDEVGYTHNINVAQIVTFFDTGKEVNIIIASGDILTYDGTEAELIRKIG